MSQANIQAHTPAESRPQRKDGETTTRNVSHDLSLFPA